jgi:hypothetical protein
MVFYHPSKTLEINSKQITQQADIPVSIANFLRKSPNHIPKFGQSVFKADEERGAIFYENGLYYLVKEGFYVKLADDTVLGPYDWTTDKLINQDSVLEKAGNELKAQVQYFNNSMIANSFVQ